jgi:nigerose phosphorylase
MKTVPVDLTGESKPCVGDLYIGGTRPAAHGGAWMSAVFRCAGLRTGTQGLTPAPRPAAH